MRLATIRIESFRGIPGRITLDLRKREGAVPSSLLLLGDNGSGKSSIVDALEFVLRGGLWRRIDPDRPVKRLAGSMAASTRPYVEVTYADGRRVARGGEGHGRFQGSTIDIGDDPEPTFSLAPIVLRRADILGFWQLEPSRRKLVFVDYFTPDGLGVRALAEAKQEVAAAQSKLPRHEAHAKRCIEKLAAATKTGVDELPRDPVALAQFRRNVLLKRFATTTKGRFGEIRVRRDVHSAHKAATDAFLQLHRTRRQLQEGEARLAQGRRQVAPEVEEVIAEANQSLGSSFLAVTGLHFISDVLLKTEENSTALDVVLRLANGQEAAPEDVLSEASMDLLALLIYVSVIKATASHGQARVLALDDVFQSVDAVYRGRATRHIVEELRNWQLFVTTHDRLWFELLAASFQAVSASTIQRRIVNWDFQGGPKVLAGEIAPGRPLEVARHARDPVLICSSAGLLLEEICDRLSWTLPVAVQRRRDDKYDLGGLWPPVRKKLVTSNLRAELDAVSESVTLRNLVGAHFNEWARSISQREAEAFGDAVRSLFCAVYCEECASWIEAGANAGEWACPRGHVRVVEKATAA
jgi:hypothetical protein